MDATTAGWKSIGSAPAWVLVVYVVVVVAAIVAVIVTAIAVAVACVGVVPKQPPVPEFGFLVDPAARAIVVPWIVVRVVVVGVKEFRGRVVHPC